MARKDIKSTDGKPFSSKNQPSAELKKEGWAKKRLLKDLASMLVTGSGLEKAQKTAKSVGLDFGTEITVEIAMTMRQIDKALSDGDTQAYNAAMDRLVGKATQHITAEISDLSVEPMTLKDGTKSKV